MHLDIFLLIVSLLIVFSVILAKFSKDIGIPILLLFLGVGMLAGSDGPGGFYFADAGIAQAIGIISLMFILFAGGLETKWRTAKSAFGSAISLSTLGVALTTLLVGLFLHLTFQIPILVSLLFGAIVSSTDVAAVISVLNFRNLNLKGDLKPLLELESGTNDPMAVFLTISLTALIKTPETSYAGMAGLLVMQMCLGFLIGVAGGKCLAWLINKLRFPIEGFYPVFVLAFATLIYSLAASIKGSGFLAVYVAGVFVGNETIVFRKTLLRFFDGLAWLAQIGMFLTLGLLVFPKELIVVSGIGLVISLFLIFVARPVAVYIALSFSKYNWREKMLISWVGLRGAVPIILSTFPLLEGIKEANWIFNVVFFIVITSAILQGWTIPWFAKILKLDAPPENKVASPIEFSYPQDTNMILINITVPDKENFRNKSLVEIPELKGSLIVTISREGKYFVPSGGTIIQPGDILQVLAEKDKVKYLKQYFSHVSY